MAKFLSATEAAPRVGFSAWTLVDYCRNFPGFGFRLRPGGRWRIPEEHIARLLAGEPVPEIAASPSLPLKPHRNRRAHRLEVADAPS